MSGSTQVAEADLHAYVDDQLPAQRRAAVEQYLAANPEDARRVDAWIAQRDALRAAFAPIAAAALPAKLELDRLIQERSQRRSVPWLTAASILLALAVGGAAGWAVRGTAEPNGTALAMSLLEQEALTTHVVYAADKRHPIEVGADEKAHLTQWLSNRLSRSVTPPSLDALGFHLIGGRLLATEHGGAAALFMYEDAQGRRLSLVLRPMSSDMHASPADMREGTVNGAAWIAGGVGCAVVASLPDIELQHVANQVRQELPSAG